MNSRKNRIEHGLRDVLSRIIRTTVKDPRVREVDLITVTNVELVDVANAQIYVSIVANGPKAKKRIASCLEALQGAAPVLRGPAARELNLKRPPELHFIHDQSADIGEKINAALAADRAKAKARDGE